MGVTLLLGCGARFDLEPAGATGGAGGEGGAIPGGGMGGMGMAPCRALDFDGDDDVVSVPDAAELDVLGEITVEAWVRFGPHVREMHIVANHHHEQKTGYVLLIYGADDAARYHLNFRYQTGTESHQVGYDEISPDAWHHVAGTYDGDKLHSFIDGVETNDADAPDGMHTAPYSGPLTIGSAHYSPSFAFAGLIDEVRISRVARYQNGESPERHWAVDGDTVALWRFDEPDEDQAARDEVLAHPGRLGATEGADDADPARVDVPCF